MNVVIKKTEDLKYLKTINLQRVKDKKIRYGGNKDVLSPDDLKQNDKIYIFPNCKIKKLPLRKYLKDKDIKQVFNPKEADILVMKEHTLSFSSWSGNTINFTKRFEIPIGTYNYNYDENKVYAECSQSRYYDYSSFKRFVFNVHIKNDNNDYYYLSKYDKMYDKYEETYKCKVVAQIGHSKVNEDHIEALVDKSKNFINEVDLQQVVYDWEVAKKVRVDSVDYNWKAIQDLLESKDSWELAIEMIKKLDIEAILSKLICCYYGRKIKEHVLKAIYQKIFSRNPLLLKCVGRWNNYSVCGTYNINGIKTMLRDCKQNNIKINLEDFKLFGISVEPLTTLNGDIVYHITNIESDN
jgi:hypothetical protein